MKVHLYNHQKDLPVDKRLIRDRLKSLFSFLKISCDEVSLYFVSEKKISDLHKEFFNDPSPTDCITFPIDDSFLGEIFVCPKTALSYAKKRGIDPQEELFLYIIHGTLHLIGYDDLEPKKRQAMRKKEKSCIAFLEKLYKRKPIDRLP